MTNKPQIGTVDFFFFVYSIFTHTQMAINNIATNHTTLRILFIIIIIILS